uniref:Uncharacterized protein n=1 Tax=Aegilops tauschii subsp. strangulata TaxID=200361 RepID=A0A453N3D1_AEGTS
MPILSDEIGLCISLKKLQQQIYVKHRIPQQKMMFHGSHPLNPKTIKLSASGRRFFIFTVTLTSCTSPSQAHIKQVYVPTLVNNYYTPVVSHCSLTAWLFKFACITYIVFFSSLRTTSNLASYFCSR